MSFSKAVKTESKLRLALGGVSGSGKTFSALSIAKHLGGKVALIDTEHASASKYSDLFDFDTAVLTDSYSPVDYLRLVNQAVEGGYKTLIIDSLSHAWNGRNGILEQNEIYSQRMKINSFQAWGKCGTPLYTSFVEGILAANIHVIATVRMKQEYAMIEENGKTRPQKIGMGLQQREGLEYEMDIFGEMDLENRLIISKSRLPEISGRMFPKPGEEFAKILARWLSSEKPASEPPVSEAPAFEPPAQKAQLADPVQVQKAIAFFQAKGISVEYLEDLAGENVARWAPEHLEIIRNAAKPVKREVA